MVKMSGSEKDFSESSNLGSPPPQGDSPYSSPSQQVPHLVNVFSEITCADDITMHNTGRPYLRVVEQPQDYFRFRYKSEMVGTHGCLLGKGASSSKHRTHPTVELMNYTGKALIRVRLTQSDKDDEHPHKLLEDEQEDRDVSTVVPEQGSYRVGFAGMGIIHTAKKDVPGLLFKKYMERARNNVTSIPNLRAHCESAARTINLNIVRLRFSAHDLVTDKEICPPAFSEPIHNMKSAATNDLKICRISRYTGKPKGGDDVFILVEKVNKKNILIRFYELNEHDEEVWAANANFLQSDVHHQYAIVFRTPPYRDLQISKDVKVFIELVRPSDGRTSEPKEFVYKPDQVYRQNKRRRVHSSYSSLDSSSGGSIKSGNEVPATVEMINNNDPNEGPSMPGLLEISIPTIPVAPSPMESNDLAGALFQNLGVSYTPSVMPSGVLLGQGAGPSGGAGAGAGPGAEPPVISLNSAELERLINHDPHLPSEERKKFAEMDWTEYMQSFGDSLPDNKTHNSMDFLSTSMHLVADSGKAKPVIKQEPMSPSRSDERRTNIVDKAKSNEGYNAYYKAEDGEEVKKLVKEICEIYKNKAGHKKHEVRNKLERLFEMRLSNGDTFLHMALSSSQPSLQYMVRLVHSLRMPRLLNLANDLQQTVLHFAVIHDMPQIVATLVAKGCDPMMSDLEGNNVIHYAVVCGTCLKPLLDAIRQFDVPCDINAYNNDKQTALHLAAVYDSAESVELLLRHGADWRRRDSAGRTPAHLAAADTARRALAALLLRAPQNEIDAVDGAGNTILQILCSPRATEPDQETLRIVQMLLDKKADINKQSPSCECPLRLSAWSAALRALLARHAAGTSPAGGDIKSEPEDEYESADEGPACSERRGLRELSSYVRAVSARLDGGAWRALARRLHVDALDHWYASTRSPTATMLTHVKESGDSISSKTLATILEDMGELEAANIIRRYIE